MTPETLADLGALFASAPSSGDLMDAAETFLGETDAGVFAGIEVMAALFGCVPPSPLNSPATAR